MRNLKTLSLMVLVLLSVGLIFAAVNPVLTNLDINPNPMDKQTTIELSFAKNVGVEIFIETLEGELVKTIYSGNLNQGNYEFIWDRNADNGEYVPEGTYNLTINYNTRYTSTKKTLILK